MSRTARFLFALALGVFVAAAFSRADAGVVSGRLLDRDGKALGDRQVHFENRVSGDIYLARTGSDGSFSAEVPPGIYDVRAERGLVVKSHVVVGTADLSVGQVFEGAPLDVRRPFEREGIGPSMVDSGAPATAHLHSAEPAPSPAAAPTQATASAAPLPTPSAK
jgi:hypothetical protein